MKKSQVTTVLTESASLTNTQVSSEALFVVESEKAGIALSLPVDAIDGSKASIKRVGQKPFKLVAAKGQTIEDEKELVLKSDCDCYCIQYNAPGARWEIIASHVAPVAPVAPVAKK
jgi:hypothetical protein